MIVASIFSIRWNKPVPLASLEHTFTARERIASDGEIVEPLSLEDLDILVEAVKRENYEAIAICFLFSFKNPEHELKAAAYLSERLPDVAIALSHQVSPEWREFERTSTTVMDSYLAPVVRKYLETLVGELKDRLPAGQGLHVMESNGGVMSAASASQSPLQTLFVRAGRRRHRRQGALGGYRAAQPYMCRHGRHVFRRQPDYRRSAVRLERNQAGRSSRPDVGRRTYTLSGPAGGSIAWEEAGAMRVGPQSAGSNPGPVCYGLGGTEPTVSDANLVLGRLDGANFSGGEMTLDRAAAAGVLSEMGRSFRHVRGRNGARGS